MTLEFKGVPENDEEVVDGLVKAVAVYMASLIMNNDESDLVADDLQDYTNQRLEMMGQENWFGEAVSIQLKEMLK